MDWGMKNRFSKIIKPDDGRCVMLAVDHGYFLGPTEKLEVPQRTIKPLLPFADSLMLTRGVLRTSVNPSTNLSKETITTSIEDAVKLNVSCMALSIFIGSKYEHQTLANLSTLVDQGEKYGIPVLAVTAVGKEMVRDARYLSLACRIAAELGSHLVKTYYCENFEKVIEGCPVPIIIAGGKKLEKDIDVLKLTFNAIREGAAGVDMGRNIWQSEYPLAMIKAVRSIVHENFSVKEAYDLFVKEKGKEHKSTTIAQ